MLIVHQVTFKLYLVATITYYIVYASWNPESKGSGDAVYITWGISVIMSAISQCVLIFIYWGLAAEVKVKKDPSKREDEAEDEEMTLETGGMDFGTQQIEQESTPEERKYTNSML